MANFVIKRDDGQDVDYWLWKVDLSPTRPTEVVWVTSITNALVFDNRDEAQNIADMFIKKKYTIELFSRRLTPNWKYAYQHVDT